MGDSSRVGLNTKTYISDSQLRNDEIIKIIEDIQKSSIDYNDKESHFSNIYPEFKENYPFLFSMACKPNFDYKKFNYMMNLRTEIINKNLTVEDASKEVGTKFYNMYMKK